MHPQFLLWLGRKKQHRTFYSKLQSTHQSPHHISWCLQTHVHKVFPYLYFNLVWREVLSFVSSYTFLYFGVTLRAVNARELLRNPWMIFWVWLLLCKTLIFTIVTKPIRISKAPPLVLLHSSLNPSLFTKITLIFLPCNHLFHI